MRARGGRMIPAISWTVTILWIFLLFFFSGQNASESSGLSGWATELILRLFPFIHITPQEFEPILRKIAHFSIFAVTGILFGIDLNMARPKRSSAAIWLVSLAVLSVLNELYQMWSDGRSCEFRDMCIDFGGAVFGLLVLIFVSGLFRRIRKRFSSS